MSRRHRMRCLHRQAAMNIPGGRHALATPDPLFSPNALIVIGYGPGGFEEKAFTSLQELVSFKDKWPVIWIDIDGLGNSELILSLGNFFGLPVLVLEDIFDVNR